MALKLYDHQINAIKKMHNGCILNGGTGSGKSLTALGYYYIQNGGSWDYLQGGIFKRLKCPKDLYIITTAMKRDTLEWVDELSHFLMSPYPDCNYYPNQTIVIDSWNNIKKYIGVKDAFFMFDEDKVTGSGAWVDAFYKIAKSNDWIILSATPGDTWEQYIPVFIANGFYRNKTEFIREHIVYNPYTQWRQVQRYLNTGRLIRLRKRILIDMDFDRHTIQHHENVFVKYDKKLYFQAINDRWDPFKNQPIEQAAGLCYVLRQITNTDESRQVALLELVEKHPKVIIFYNFDYELDILKNLYYGEDVEIAEWNGHAHQPIPNSNRWVYLVNYNAGAEGWNSVQTNCIIFYSQTYSYKTLNQACGRIDRINTKFIDLYYYHLKSRSGIDLGISKALSKKKKFNEGKFVGGL